MSSADQPIGFPLPEWTARERPPRTPMEGRWCRVEPIDIERHAVDLFEANSFDSEGRNWTYLSIDRPRDLETYIAWLRTMSGDDPMLHAVIDLRSGKAVGVAAYMRIDRANGVIEVAHINYSPLLQRTVAATEAMYLMMRRAFDELGYRRYEWKCDALNARSRAAAERLGFTFEGIFRQAVVYKKRNRDTAWFSIIDSEWPALKREFERWLDPENFDASGVQRTPLRHRGAGRAEEGVVARKGGYEISTDRSRLDIDWITHSLASASYWAPGIPREVVEHSIAGSLCFGIYGSDRQVGFARVVTDYATFAWLADVFIDESDRGRGLGTWLAETVMAHPSLQGLRRWMLATRDAHAIYAKAGFNSLSAPETIMERRDPDVYRRN